MVRKREVLQEMLEIMVLGLEFFGFERLKVREGEDTSAIDSRVRVLERGVRE